MNVKVQAYKYTKNCKCENDQDHRVRIESLKLNWTIVCFGFVVDCIELIWEDRGWYELLLYIFLFLSFCFCESNGECVWHESMIRCLLLMNNVIFLYLFVQQYGYLCYE